jgi:hypothetical protein
VINFQHLMQQWAAGLLQITHPIDNARACDPIQYDQHPDHQFWSNRGTTNGAIETLQLRAHALQVVKLVGPSKQVVIVTFASMNVCLLG